MCLILGVGAGQRPFFMGKVIRIDFPTRKKVCPVINVFPGHMSKLILRRRKVRSILNLGVEGGCKLRRVAFATVCARSRGCRSALLTRCGYRSKCVVHCVILVSAGGCVKRAMSHSRRYELNLAAVGAFDCAATHTWLCSGVFPTVTW